MKRVLATAAAVFAAEAEARREVPKQPIKYPRKTRPPGKSTRGNKALKSYRARYTHVLSAYCTDNNLARMAAK